MTYTQALIFPALGVGYNNNNNKQLRVIAWYSDWLIALFASVVIGQSNYFGFSCTTGLMTVTTPSCLGMGVGCQITLEVVE